MEAALARMKGNRTPKEPYDAIRAAMKGSKTEGKGFQLPEDKQLKAADTQLKAADKFKDAVDDATQESQNDVSAVI